MAAKPAWDGKLGLDADVHTAREAFADPPRRGLISLWLWIGLCILGSGYGGCSSDSGDASGTASHPRGGTLRLIQIAPLDLDPLYVDDVYEATITNQIYDGLIGLDETCNLMPSLASSWTVSPDGKEYEFRIRPNARFSDGTRLTSLDVVVTLASILSPNKEDAVFAETYVTSIEGAEAVQKGTAAWPTGLSAPDSTTIRIRLEEPLATFLAALTMDQARIVPWWERVSLISGGLEAARGYCCPEILEAARAQSPTTRAERIAPLGSGPFAAAEWVPGDHVMLVRNPHYWLEQPGVDTLLFLTRETWDADDVMRLFLDREVEMTFVPQGRLEELKDAGARIDSYHELSVSFIAMRVDRPPFDQLLFRQAVAQAVDLGKLATINPGVTEPATGILPPGMPGYSPIPRGLPYDPQAARDALQRLGYGPDNPAPACTLFTNRSSNPDDRRFARFVTEDLADVGIPLTVEYLDWSGLDEGMAKGSLGMFSIGWVADLPDPDSFFQFLFHTKGDNNIFGFSDPAVDRLIEEARVARPAERWRLYRRLEGLVLSQAPIVPLSYAQQLMAWQPYVDGVRPSALGAAMMRLKDARLEPVDDRLTADAGER